MFHLGREWMHMKFTHNKNKKYLARKEEGEPKFLKKKNKKLLYVL